MGRKTCIKCGKGVSVLVCKSSKCPVSIHESCMPSSLQVHDRENFCCPYCLYKQSVAECQKAKDKALKARRKLSIFLGKKSSKNNEFEPNITRDKWTTLQNHDNLGNQERMGKCKEGWYPLQAENDPKGGACSVVHVKGMLSDEGAAMSAADKKRGYLRSCKCSLKVARCINGIKLVENQKNWDGQFCGILCSKVEGEVLTGESLRACEKRTDVEYHFKTPMPLSVACRGLVQFHQPIHNYIYKNENFTHNQQHLEPFYYPNMEKGMQLEPSQCNFWGKNQELGKLAEVNLLKGENKWHGEAGPYKTAICSMSKGDGAQMYEQSDSGGETYISGNYVTETYVRLARQSIQNATESMNFNQPGKVSDKPSGNEVYHCNDPNIITSSSAGWIDKPSNKIMNGVTSDARRKRLRWTTEEEEMLKKGVLIFSMGVKKNLPWRKILEFGCHVFDKSRTPSDLKSKWKIISRKAHLELNEG